jgi:hypothetical protein
MEQENKRERAHRRKEYNEEVRVHLPLLVFI